MRKYELTPTDGRKSFYGKAVVIVEDNGTETLYSYNTHNRPTHSSVLRVE